MRSKYLGDSFDIVKRFWAEQRAAIAPVFAHPNFVPVEIRPEYEKMVGMPVLSSSSDGLRDGTRTRHMRARA
jgi:hypothetical protein